MCPGSTPIPLQISMSLLVACDFCPPVMPVVELSEIITVTGVCSTTTSNNPVMPEWVKVESPITATDGCIPASDAPFAMVMDAPMVISVSAQGTYLVNGRQLLDSRAETLEKAIRVLAGENLGGQVTVSADADASHQAVITAMDVAGRLGYVEINIATIKPGAQ